MLARGLVPSFASLLEYATLRGSDAPLDSSLPTLSRAMRCEVQRRSAILKGIDGEELNGPGLTVGVIAWLVLMAMVGAETSPGASMGVSGDAIVLGIIAIGMLAPAWIAASIASIFFRKK